MQVPIPIPVPYASMYTMQPMPGMPGPFPMGMSNMDAAALALQHQQHQQQHLRPFSMPYISHTPSAAQGSHTARPKFTLPGKWISDFSPQMLHTGTRYSAHMPRWVAWPPYSEAACPAATAGLDKLLHDSTELGSSTESEAMQAALQQAMAAHAQGEVVLNSTYCCMYCLMFCCTSCLMHCCI